MGIFDKIKGMVGSDDLDYNEYDSDLFGDEPMVDAGAAQNAGAYDVGFGGFEQPQPQPQAAPRAAASGSSLELKVVKPDRFENASQIADHLLNRRTVVLNLEGTNKETARRLIDFLSGVAYSIDGQLKRVANNTFVITPNNVDVSGDQLRNAEPKPQPEPSVADLYAEL